MNQRSSIVKGRATELPAGGAGTERGSTSSAQRGLPGVLGNRMALHLLSSQRVQLKAREAAGPGGAAEQEADHAAESVAPGAGVSAAPPPAASRETGSAAPAAPAALIAGDEAEHVESGQMRKSEFLAEVRTAVCATADEGLQASGQTAQGCPWIEYWLSYYGGQDAPHLERALHKFAPAAAGVTSARDYVPIVAARVRQGVDRYAKTGETPDLPDGMADEMPGGGLLGAAASILFKAREGGAHAEQDPQVVRSRLGPGEPLDSGVRSRMSAAFGTGFSHVRVHTGGEAAALSDEMNARAFTVGEHVAFSPGEYDPHSTVGQALIAHELAHVVQQSGVREGKRRATELARRHAVFGVGRRSGPQRGARGGFDPERRRQRPGERRRAGDAAVQVGPAIAKVRPARSGSERDSRDFEHPTSAGRTRRPANDGGQQPDQKDQDHRHLLRQ